MDDGTVFPFVIVSADRYKQIVANGICILSRDSGNETGKYNQ